jgi:hypothetical protein
MGETSASCHDQATVFDTIAIIGLADRLVHHARHRRKAPLRSS